MLSFIGYNFLQDKNCIDAFPINPASVNNVELRNGIYDFIHADSDTAQVFSTAKPIAWTSTTMLECNFNDNLNAGNVNYIASQIDQIKIKRRKIGEFTWTTIKIIDINTAEDLSFAFVDTMLPNNSAYEYAFVPIFQNNEQDYIIKEVISKFRGIYICGYDEAYQFYANVGYGTSNSNIQMGVFTPFNRRYPVVVSNGIVNYETGSFSALIPSRDFKTSRKLDVQDIQKQTEYLKAFLTNKKPKILKDVNGGEWLVFISPPSVNYDNNMQMGVKSISMNWTEIGDYKSKEDLYNAGFIPSKE